MQYYDISARFELQLREAVPLAREKISRRQSTGIRRCHGDAGRMPSLD